MFHFVYKITNTQNQKFYIGVHSTEEIEDGYMGSGSLLKKEIKQFGLQCFERQIMDYFDTRDELLRKEAEIVDLMFISNPLTYNLVCGGGRGIKTVKEKAIYFNKNKVTPLEFRKKAFERFDPEWKVTFSLKKPIEFYRRDEGENKMNMIYNFIVDFLEKRQNEFMSYLSDCYNNKYERKFAEKMLLNIITRQGFYDNIHAIETKWE